MLVRDDVGIEQQWNIAVLFGLHDGRTKLKKTKI